MFMVMMSLNSIPTSFQSNRCFRLSPFVIPKHKQLIKIKSFSSSTEGGFAEDDNSPASDSEGLLSSSRAQLDLLEQMTYTGSSVNGYETESGSQKLTIREQLARLVGDRDDDFSIPLGKNLKKVSEKFLTTSQKRNIRRQAYLNQVSQRNDSVFFATIGAFVILPPLLILGIAIITGYVQLFP